MTADPITRAVACNLCTGCGACAGAFPDFIRMVDDPLNGRRPVVAKGAAAQKAAVLAASLCAGAGADFTSLPRADAIDRDWGPVVAAWQGHATDSEIRHRGASGEGCDRAGVVCAAVGAGAGGGPYRCPCG